MGPPTNCYFDLSLSVCLSAFLPVCLSLYLRSCSCKSTVCWTDQDYILSPISTTFWITWSMYCSSFKSILVFHSLLLCSDKRCHMVCLLWCHSSKKRWIYKYTIQKRSLNFQKSSEAEHLLDSPVARYKKLCVDSWLQLCVRTKQDICIGIVFIRFWNLFVCLVLLYKYESSWKWAHVQKLYFHSQN